MLCDHCNAPMQQPIDGDQRQIFKLTGEDETDDGELVSIDPSTQINLTHYIFGVPSACTCPSATSTLPGNATLRWKAPWKKSGYRVRARPALGRAERPQEKERLNAFHSPRPCQIRNVNIEDPHRQAPYAPGSGHAHVEHLQHHR